MSMNVIIKTPEDIEGMRIAGRLAAQVLEMITPHVKAGITTDELDRLCHDYIVNEQNAIPAPLNYGAAPGRPGFPKSICTSINHVVCHGIPGEKKLKKGDVMNIDVTVIKDGYHGDTSKMFIIGETQPFNERLVQVTQECLYKAIDQVRPGIRLSDIGRIIEEHAHANHFTVVEEYCGHGIGRGFHEDPQVLHYNGYNENNDCILREGMTFTIEPMINAGKKNTKLLGDGWTAVTKDRRPSAQWEHTLLVTADGVEVLTRRPEETF
ncbi:type I methionyl aminopeptidase [Endozoicomonas gorgoniicola]|uniref:Methionine aminopeptidase n=1 Tax=Endozoicomonas gorgoniicola TaxID=1234144 RepID=A0ABT3MV48_9GAMM|nr:type I methionyl aminopeptidase [Endozoicomonas gorgoniicola]MCW7553261.1 type I methionyl aminopeptidase [Endozoicomonas gorgoniicola]